MTQLLRTVELVGPRILTRLPISAAFRFVALDSTATVCEHRRPGKEILCRSMVIILPVYEDGSLKATLHWDHLAPETGAIALISSTHARLVTTQSRPNRNPATGLANSPAMRRPEMKPGRKWARTPSKTTLNGPTGQGTRDTARDRSRPE
ncbi:hypothetical protein L209DRAFT_82223 [Thermothelomyces heterothallicus CBS 203.75]